MAAIRIRTQRGATTDRPRLGAAGPLPARVVLAAVLVVALVGAAGIAALHRSTARAHRIQVHLLVLDEVAEERQGMLWHVLVVGGSDPELLAALRRTDDELEAAVAALAGEDAGVWARAAAAFAPYDARFDEVLALLDAGRLDDARALATVDGRGLDPLLTAFRGVVDADRDAAGARAARADRESLIGAALVLVVAALVIGGFAWRSGGRLAEADALRRSEARFRALVQHAGDLLAIADPAGALRYVGPSVEHFLGHRPGDLVGADGFALAHPDDRPRLRALVAEVLAMPGGTGAADVRARHADGSWRWFEVAATNLVADPAVGGVVVNAREVTDRKAAEAALTGERDLLQLIMDSLPDQVFVKDAASRFLRINRASAAVLGLADPAEAVGKTDADFGPAEAAAAYAADDRRVMATRRPLLDQTETIVAGDGGVRWIATSKAPTFDAAGNVTGVVGVSRDVTERKALEQQLAHQAFHDPLTGLPNRSLFADRLEHALARAARTADPLAVLFVDLDGFKVVNDSLGHRHGDAFLVAVADRLPACVRTGDTVARVGGDEFVVLLEDADADRAVEAAQRIAQRLAVPVDLDGHAVPAAASIGIACKTSPLDRPEDLLRKADLAMYAAKQRGKAQYALFDDGMQTRAWARLELEADLRRALARDEFRVFYQPIVDLATGRTVEVEALVRWAHPQRGMVPPGEFVPVAEETGLILPLGWWVLTEACRQARAWQVGCPHEPRLGIGVNLSPRMFQHPGLVAEVARILAETGLDPASLKLEITEGVMIDDGDAAIETLRRLKGLGVRLAVDDFGTGYSSLTYLQRLPIDVLKVDRSFVARLGEDPESLEIVRLIVGLAKTLGMAVVGEGIETAAQAATLRDLGADRGQGYFFARPGPAAEVGRALGAEPAGDEVGAIGAVAPRRA